MAFLLVFAHLATASSPEARLAAQIPHVPLRARDERLDRSIETNADQTVGTRVKGYDARVRIKPGANPTRIPHSSEKAAR